MAKKISFGNAILCDYVGIGSNNKHVLVNVYSGDIIVAALPAELSLGIYVELTQQIDAPLKNMTIELCMGGNVFLRAQGEMEPGKPTALFVIQMFQMRVDEPGDFELFFKADGYSRTSVIRKSISVGTIPGVTLPNALPRPVLRPPPDAPAS